MARIIALPILPVVCLIWFLVPAQATPARRSDKVTLHLSQQDLEAKAGTIEVYFNPKDLTVDKSVPWKKGQGHEGDAPATEFTAGEPQTMHVELMFDLFEEGTREHVDVVPNLEKVVGQTVPITWSDRLWVGKLKEFKPRPLKGNGNEPPRLTIDTTWTDVGPVGPSPRHPFSVEIKGAPEAKTMIREVSIDPQDLPPPADGRLRQARFTIASPRGLNPELVKWAQVGDRRTIQVTIFDEAVSPVRSYAVDVEGPVTYEIVDPNAEVPYALLQGTIAGGSLSWGGSGGVGPVPENPPGPGGDGKPMPLVGFAVTILDLQGQSETADFREVGGLKTDTEVTDLEQGGIQGPPRKVQGVTKWPNLVLKGGISGPLGKLFIEWVNLAGQGKPSPRTVLIAPLYLKDGKPVPHHRTLVLSDVVPDRYKFPDLSGIWSDGELVEEIGLPPSFGELK